MSEGDDIRVQLARMEGKLDLSNLRHDQTEARLAIIDTRLNGHGDRISGIEKREVGRDGERKGIALSGRLLWATTGLIPGGAIVAVLVRLFH